MAMTYADLQQAMYSILVIDATDAEFPLFFPRIIEAAEMRCYREIDFLATRRIATATITAGTYQLAGPSDWLIGRHLYLQTAGGVRTTLLRREESFLSEYWPNRTTQAVPKYWCEPTIGQLIIAPTVDTTYTLEMAYTYRPTALSASNTTTWLATNAPDLFMYAALVVAAGYAKNYGQRSDDPQMALSWEDSYQKAKASVLLEELRRKVTDPTPAETTATA